MKRQIKPKISVLIITRNRAMVLKKCLDSLVRQKYEGIFEVVVVDNGSTDATKKVVSAFSRLLNLTFVVESQLGIPFARNTSIKVAKAEILAFLDDDCIVSQYWLETIDRHFELLPGSTGVVGYAKPLVYSTPSLVEQFFYERWLIENGLSLTRLSQIISTGVMDFKNAAFAKNAFSKISFSTKAPFGDVGDEDIEIGNRLVSNQQQIYFDPTLLALHRNSTNYIRLFYRNFWNGYANQSLESMSQTTQRLSFSRLNNRKESLALFLSFLDLCHPVQKVLLFFAILIFPLFSKLGRFWALVTSGSPIFMPQRK